MSLTVSSASLPQPIIKELQGGWRVELSFTWDGHYFNISPTISFGGIKTWPASLKGVPSRTSLQELRDAEKFLKNAKFDVRWVSNRFFVEVTPRLRGGMKRVVDLKDIELDETNDSEKRENSTHDKHSPKLSSSRPRSSVLKLNDSRIFSSINEIPKVDISFSASHNVSGHTPIEIKKQSSSNSLLQGFSNFFNSIQLKSEKILLEIKEKFLKQDFTDPPKNKKAALQELKRGSELIKQGRVKEALSLYLDLEKIVTAFEDQQIQRLVYWCLGAIYSHLGDFKAAIEFHKKLLAIVLELGDRSGQREAYVNLRIAYDSLGDFKTAIEFDKKLLAIVLELGNRSNEGAVYGNLGIAYDKLGDFKRAIEFHKKDLAIALELGDRAIEGKSYGNLGIAYHNLGDFKRAVEFLKKDLAIALELGNRSGEEGAYGNLGIAYYRLGDFKGAIEFHKKDLAIALELENRSREGIAYGNLGNAHHGLGDFKGAIEFYKKVLAIAQELGDRSVEGRAYANLGNAYHSLGDFKGAIEFCKKALAILELGDRSGEGTAYNNLASIYDKLKDYPSAEENGRKAVEVFSQIQRSLGKDSWKITIFELQAQAYSQLLLTLINQGKIEEALSIADFGKSRALSDFLNMRAQLPLNEKPLSHLEIQKIASSQNATLVFFTHEPLTNEPSIYSWVVPPQGEITFHSLKPKASFTDKLGSAFSTLAPFQTREEKPSVSSEWELQNLAEVGDVREEALRETPSMNAYKVKSSRTALSNAQTPEEKCQALLILGEAYRVGGEWEALLEVGKQLETLSQKQNNLHWQCAACLILAEAFNGLGQHSEALKFAKEAEALSNKLSLKKEKSIAIQQLALTEQDPKKAMQFCQDSLNLLDTVGDTRSEAKSWRIYGVTALQHSGLTDQTPMEALERALLLLGDTFDPFERLLINRGLAQAHKEPSKALAHYNEAIRLAKGLKAATLLKEMIPQRQKVAQLLKEESDQYLRDWYDTLIAPLEKHLKQGEKVIFVPDTPLQSLPFAILKNPQGNYLIEDHIISIAPSIEVLSLLFSTKREEPTKEAFIIGDPTFDLPKSEKDANIVGEFFGITPLIGEQATLSTFIQEAPEARFLHLSCHGIAGIKPEGKIESVFEGALKLTPQNEESTYLHSLDIQKMSLKAEMVFLAACKSGKGKQQREGSIGLTRSFLAAGVPSVVATHWSIPDSDVTVDIIENFYAYILGKHPENDYQKLGKAEALQKTMVGLLEEKPELRNQPHKWGAFFLLGLN